MTLKPRASTAPSRRTRRAAAIIVVLSIVGILVLSLWYPLPLLVQGEADETRIDLAARVDGAVATRSVHRGENVQSGQWSGPARRMSSTANPVQG